MSKKQHSSSGLPRAATDKAGDHRQATVGYDNWMRSCTTVIVSDLRLKHERMKESSFLFLRGTFYRWAQLWPALCAELCGAPKVLSVGDLRVNSFGTWRDAEGRLCWGVDDFDESYPLPCERNGEAPHGGVGPQSCIQAVFTWRASAFSVAPVIEHQNQQACGGDLSGFAESGWVTFPAFPCKYSVTREACGAITHQA